MIITQSPFRISFFGGGTDYKPFFEAHGGSVLSTTFDKYVYTTIRKLPPFFDYHTQVKYARTESVRKTEEVEHPLVRNCMLHTGIHNLSVIYDADLPARSGLGSSSSFAVGLLQALYAMDGKYIGKEKLAKEAIYVERNLCGESGGWQDQIAASFGGLNRIDFDEQGFSVRAIVVSKERKRQLESRLLMFFTGMSRLSSEIAKEQVAVMESKTAELLEMKNLVYEAEKILCSQCDIEEFGKLLDHSWRLKRGLTSKVSNVYIDEIYRKGIENGAIGGKLLGAGGGGFMMFFVHPERQKAFREALSDLLNIPISFENEGAKVVHYTHGTHE